jgi:ribosomal protein L16
LEILVYRLRNLFGLHHAKLRQHDEVLQDQFVVQGKFGFASSPDRSVTERAAESRMGAGKGAVSHWVAVVKPGAILFEINGLNEEMAYEVLKKASRKLPIKTKIVSRQPAA